MNIALWIIQIVVAFYCIMGSVWRFLNFKQAALAITSINALPAAVWNVIGIIEIVCAIGLILPGLLKMNQKVTAIVAGFLTVEMLFLTGLHAKYFGLELSATNPAMWTIMLAILSALVAYGRAR
ncbi:MAG: DoxX family protein [Candidatus Margulisbacteria bacterium]|nr:DoxX family protein [Candidatus Margulisiibacteriota bacterium]